MNSTTHLPAWVRLCGVLALLFAGFGCSSTKSSDGLPTGYQGLRPGSPMRMRLSLYGQDKAFELVNESHTNRIEHYSQKRSSAMTKVASNDIMEGVTEYLERESPFGANAVEASSTGLGSSGALIRAIDLEVDGKTRSWGISKDSPVGQIQSFNEVSQALMAVFNNVYALQTVENPEGRDIFQTPTSR